MSFLTGNKKRIRGFTIIELLVAASIFVLVTTLVVTVFITTIGNQRRAFGLQNVLDNSRFAIETIARAIRQSNITGATQTTLDLDHPTKGNIQYNLSGNTIYEDSRPITGINVVVNDLQFITSGIGNNDDLQPRVTIILEIAAGGPNFTQKPGEQSSINIQTTVTPRNLELP